MASDDTDGKFVPAGWTREEWEKHLELEWTELNWME